MIERQRKHSCAILTGLLGVGMLALNVGCSTTASQPMQAFQPPPLQAQYAGQQSFYPNYTPGTANPQNYGVAPVYPGYPGGNPTGLGLNQPAYGVNPFGRWPNNSRPNIRSLNPVGFAGTTC
ncbi:MAG: hypothetical protein ACI87E_000961 [Mariniblastus sp.]